MARRCPHCVKEVDGPWKFRGRTWHLHCLASVLKNDAERGEIVKEQVEKISMFTYGKHERVIAGKPHTIVFVRADSLKELEAYKNKLWSGGATALVVERLDDMRWEIEGRFPQKEAQL